MTDEQVDNSKIMIVKKHKTRGLSAKVRRRIVKGYVPDDYCKTVNPKDPNDLALFFEDLSLMIGAPIEQAFFKYKERKGKGFPFF